MPSTLLQIFSTNKMFSSVVERGYLRSTKESISGKLAAHYGNQPVAVERTDLFLFAARGNAMFYIR